MGAAKKAKALGFKNLNQVAEYSGWSRASLDKMSVKHPDRFEAVLFGAKVKMDNQVKQASKIKYSCGCGKISEVREFTNGEMPAICSECNWVSFEPFVDD